MAVKKATKKTKEIAKKLGLKVTGRSEAQLKFSISQKRKAGKKTVAKKTKRITKKKVKAKKKIVQMTKAERVVAARTLGQAGGRKTAKLNKSRKKRKPTMKKSRGLGFW